MSEEQRDDIQDMPSGVVDVTMVLLVDYYDHQEADDDDALGDTDGSGRMEDPPSEDVMEQEANASYEADSSFDDVGSALHVINIYSKVVPMPKAALWRLQQDQILVMDGFQAFVRQTVIDVSDEPVLGGNSVVMQLFAMVGENTSYAAATGIALSILRDRMLPAMEWDALSVLEIPDVEEVLKAHSWELVNSLDETMLDEDIEDILPHDEEEM